VLGSGALIGLHGSRDFRASWIGVGKLALMACPITAVLIVFPNTFTNWAGMPKGTLRGDYQQMGKGILAWDEWRTDPARAAGTVAFNAVSILAGGKGTNVTAEVANTAIDFYRARSATKLAELGKPAESVIPAEAPEAPPQTPTPPDPPTTGHPPTTDTGEAAPPDQHQPATDRTDTGTAAQDQHSTIDQHGRDQHESAVGDTPESGGRASADSWTAPTDPPSGETPSVHTVPRPTPLEDRHPLPTLSGKNVIRTSEGRITDVIEEDGRQTPVRSHITDMVRNRGGEYAELRRAKTLEAFRRPVTGPVNSVGIDLRTGRLFEGLNRFAPASYRYHPIVETRIQGVFDEARAHGPYQYRPDDIGKYPHPDLPGSHAEVYVFDRLLKDRYGDRVPTDAEFEGFLQEIYIDNSNFKGSTVFGAPTCANCSRILYDVEIGSGKLWTFPNPPRTR
jgi:hypothetical protein